MALCMVMVAIVLIDYVIKSKTQLKSAQLNNEAKAIAVNELNVPASYYDFLISSDLEGVKAVAMRLSNKDDFYRSMAWAQLVAWVIYGSYQQDCVRAYKHRNMSSFKQLYRLDISDQQIKSAACTDLNDFQHHYAMAHGM